MDDNTANAQTQSVPLPEWTRYSTEEFVLRMAILLEYMGMAHRSQNRVVAQKDMLGEGNSYLFALEGVPTDYLKQSITVAVQRWTERYLMPASAIKAAWEEIHQDLLARSLTGSLYAGQEREVDRAAYQVVEEMGIADWKKLHGLPPEWKLGQPYPASSDLHGRAERDVIINALSLEERRVLLNPLRAQPKPDPRWRVRERAPWEIYPDREHAVFGIDKNGHETIWWVERCIEMDFPGQSCPGYVEDHSGPDGHYVTLRDCPTHHSRRTLLEQSTGEGAL